MTSPNQNPTPFDPAGSAGSSGGSAASSWTQVDPVAATVAQGPQGTPAPQGAPGWAVPSPSTTRRQGPPAWLWVLVIVVIVLVGGTGGFLLSRLGGGGASTAGTDSQGGGGANGQGAGDTAAGAEASAEVWATPTVEGPSMDQLRQATLEVPSACTGMGVSVKLTRESRTLSFMSGQTDFAESTEGSRRWITMASGDGQTVVINGEPTRAVELSCGEENGAATLKVLAFYGADLALVAAVPAIFATTTQVEHLVVTGGVEQFRLEWTVDGLVTQNGTLYGGPAGSGSAVYTWDGSAFAQQDFTWSGAFTYPGDADTSTAEGTAQAVAQAIQVGDASTLARLMTPDARVIVESPRFDNWFNQLVTDDIVAVDHQVTVAGGTCAAVSTTSGEDSIAPWFPGSDAQAVSRLRQTRASMSQVCPTNEEAFDGGLWLGMAEVDGTWTVVDVIYWVA